MKKISIIVPVYNIEEYIEECVNSIKHQKYQNIEIILVDDGAKDNSGKICDKLSKNDERIIVIHKKNGGLSDARNAGIEIATGDYLMFIDGDDFLYDDECLSKISNCIEESDADIIQYKMVYYYEKNNKFVFLNDLIKLDINDKNYLEKLNVNGQISVSACDKIIRTKLLKHNNIFFENGLLSEDVKWSYQLYLVTNTIQTLNENIYVYRQQRANSISTTRSMKNAHDLFDTIMYWKNYKYKNDKLKKQYMNLISYWYLILRVNYKSSYYTEEMKSTFKIIDKEMISYNQNYKVMISYKLSRLIGFNLTIIVMKMYIFLKNKGLIKL